MSVKDVYNIEVKAGTRNHKGTFVKDTLYKFVGVHQSGWALICIDNSTCYFVDPDDLQLKAPTPEFPFCNYPNPYYK